MTVKLHSGHDELLNAIEDVERQSLMWGDVEGSISVDEAHEIAVPLFGDEAEEALEALIDTALLLPLEVRGEERYRSRFAETVRLLARSRQTFEREPWRGSPPLVADFRIDLRKRRYPKRDLPRSDVLETFSGFTELQRAVWMAVAPAGLAAFQVEAVTALVTGSDGDRGAIITAGTGSGKTLAFYLPAFLRLAELIEKDSFWVKGLAIYPRNELLKDQLTEAYRNAGLCGEAFREAKGRPIRLGTFYGDTPARADPNGLPKNWIARGQDRLCPFLRCDCGSEMVWTKADLEAKRERLTCRACGKHSDEDRLALTRESVRRSPPDVLFTSTEMLNRSLSDPRRWEVFGVNQRKGRRPRFLLLDEAHTYTGVSGAQAALTLRRWRALHGGPLTWIGLSATLAEARRFFSDLTGVDQSRIDEITPAQDDFEEEGREYQVAVRGDPASRASLLSTSIQALMLVGRTMDTSTQTSQGRFGRRVFAFTDDLDVTHRLFDNLRDAEAYDRFGKPDGGRKPLAAMRAEVIDGINETEADRRARKLAGQRWHMPERVGRSLVDRLVIGRTTARDPGVDGRADIIVATSALEVGFNDPTVGAVVQHKAPRNFASFLQRRGRAGRNRTMRPLTLTVLSDYGRDRQAFQNYEYLFDPSLSPQSLPVRNQYVLRMQAAFALLDWLAQQPRPVGVRPASVWSSASRPLDLPGADRGWTNHLRDTIGRLVRGDPDAVGGLTAHLRQGLGLDEATVQRLLWEPPRSILLEVAPTLASRLLRNWKLAWPRADRVDDRWIADHPIPDFVPRALFSDLNLPEVEIVLPPARRTDEETFEALPIQQALSQLAPGRVTRRFGDVYGGLAHWFAVPAGIDTWSLPVSDFSEHSEFVGPFRSDAAKGEPRVDIYRPWRIRLQKANAAEVEATSNAQMNWHSAFEPNGAPLEIATPPRTAWRGLVDNVHFYLQQHRASVSVRRGALGARAEIRRPFGVQQVVDIAFVDAASAPAALGYVFETDGLSIDLTLPSDESLSTRRFAPDLERGLRAAYLKQLVHDDPQLPRQSNGFQRAWLRQIHLLATASRALRNHCNLAEASRQIALNGDVSVYEAVMDVLLGVQRDRTGPGAPSIDDDDDVSSFQVRRRPDRLDRLRKDLATQLSDVNVRNVLASTLAEALVTGGSWGRFIRTTSESTLAEALITAVTGAAPRHAATDDLVVDIQASAEDPLRVTLWLTETTVGGAGVLQAVTEPFAHEPRALFRAMEAALEPSDLELASATLAQTYRVCEEDPAIAALVDAAREEVGHGARSRTRSALLGALRDRGMEVGRAFVVSLNARMLAHSMRREHDDLVRALLAFWDRVEGILEMEFDLKEIAVLAAADTDLRQFAERVGIASTMTKTGEVATAMAALLWPRTNVLRRDSLTSYNPFRRGNSSDPALVRALLLDGEDEVIDLRSPDWTKVVVVRLAEMGAVRVSAPSNRPDLLRSAIVRLAATAITVGHLALYPTLERVSREAERTVAGFVLREHV